MGQTRLAFSEAPNEALPPECRPNFGAALLTKDNFKVSFLTILTLGLDISLFTVLNRNMFLFVQVNETYDCWYTLGIPKIKLYRDSFFGCQADDLSFTDIAKQYSIV